MKKLFLALLLAVFTLSTYSCRETTESETVIEGNDDFEEAGEELESEMEEIGNEIDEEVDVDVDADDDM